MTHHRHSIRWQDYDYTANGAYFVTICTHAKAHLFGDIVNGSMDLNEWGQIVNEEWQETALRRSYIELDAFIVMPNHFHGILIVNQASKSVTSDQPRQFSKPLAASLGSILGTFKAAVTRRINLLREDTLSPIWQRNYHEHIIRNHDRYEFIRAYIETNPQRWIEDSLYTQNRDNLLPS